MVNTHLKTLPDKYLIDACNLPQMGYRTYQLPNELIVRETQYTGKPLIVETFPCLAEYNLIRDLLP